MTPNTLLPVLLPLIVDRILGGGVFCQGAAEDMGAVVTGNEVEVVGSVWL
jgi:hypothetical protein